MAYKLLVVEDDKDIREIIKDYFTDENKSQVFNVTEAENGTKALEIISENEFNLIFLDVMLPGLDGFSICRKIREKQDVPVIFISARTMEEDVLLGFETGCDDYVTKPYTPEELLLRIKAVLRRTYHLTENKSVNLGAVRVDLSSGIVIRPDGEAELTAKEFQLFSKLYDNQGKIVSLNVLMDTLWPDGSYGLENSLIVHVRRLREKIEEDPSSPAYLQTVRVYHSGVIAH